MNGDGIMTDERAEVGEFLAGSRKGFAKIIVAAVFVLVVIVAFYLLYWVKTPQYSLGVIKEAVAKHDLVTFEKRVDLQNIGNNAIDDIIATTIPKEDLQTQVVVGIITMVKSVAVPEFVVQVQKYVKTGNVGKLEEQNDGQVIVASVAERTGIMAMKFMGIESTDRNKNEAIVNIKLFDQQLDENFILKLQMKQMGDGNWGVTQIANLKEFIAKRDVLVKKRLATLNKPIQDKINENVQIITTGAAPLSVERVSKDNDLVIKTWIPFKVLAPNIKSVNGTLLVYDKTKNVIFSRDFTSGEIDLSKSKEGLWHFNNSWILNSYDSSDKEISACDLTQTTSEVVFTAVYFNDGTKAIKCYDTLPAK